jgi:magnesium chelatase family protein
MLDRIDMHIEVPAIPFTELDQNNAVESSETIRERVIKARNRQNGRSGKANALMSSAEVDQFCKLAADCRWLMKQASERMGISARAYHRLLKVALTIADLNDDANIGKDHLMEAISYRAWENE